MARCDGLGGCRAVPDEKLVGSKCKEPQGDECKEYKCAESGACVAHNLGQETSCSLTGIHAVCQKAVCSSGQCVSVAVDNVACQPPPRASGADAIDRNVTLCQNFICSGGSCVSVPKVVGTNCTHRLNESDLEEKICLYSVCDGAGLCVVNQSSPLCTPPRSKRKATAAIVGGAMAGVVVVLAAVAVGAFVASRAAPPVAAGAGGDAAFGASAVNPTYVQLVDNANPMYG